MAQRAELAREKADEILDLITDDTGNIGPDGMTALVVAAARVLATFQTAEARAVVLTLFQEQVAEGQALYADALAALDCN